MKQFNKHILEAINRGIQLALDDYEDNDTLIVPQRDTIKYDDTLIEYYVQKILEIPLPNNINVEEKTLQEIGKNYDEILKLVDKGRKYVPTDRAQLKELIRHIVVINIGPDLNWIDTSKMTSFLCLFDDFFSKYFCGDISKWDTSNVKNMYKMFYQCDRFNRDITNWDVSNVENFDFMFGECHLFNQNISKWNTSNAKSMSCMFMGCKNFNQDISNWDVHNVKDMAHMFSRCESLYRDLSKWDVSNVERNNGFYFKAKFANNPEYVPNFDIEKTMGNV